MNQIITRGIILARTDFGEADRIITMLTPDRGKLRLMAKGVRKLKSKLAGGIELFSTSEITYLPGRGEIGTLVSTRLLRHYAHIVEAVGRTMLGYELIRQLHKATEDEPEPDYYQLLEQAFQALDDANIDLELIKLWFSAQLLRLGGFTPNLQTDVTGNKLQADAVYDFGFEDTAFTPRPDGRFHADHIKFLRLVFSGNQPKILSAVQDSSKLTTAVTPLVQSILSNHLRI